MQIHNISNYKTLYVFVVACMCCMLVESACRHVWKSQVQYWHVFLSFSRPLMFRDSLSQNLELTIRAILNCSESHRIWPSVPSGLRLQMDSTISCFNVGVLEIIIQVLWLHSKHFTHRDNSLSLEFLENLVTKWQFSVFALLFS